MKGWGGWGGGGGEGYDKKRGKNNGFEVYGGTGEEAGKFGTGGTSSSG